jgi:hypothetical protein
MGVDLHGKAPRSNAGRYFGANWGAWRDLAGVCFTVVARSNAEVRSVKTMFVYRDPPRTAQAP